MAELATFLDENWWVLFLLLMFATSGAAWAKPRKSRKAASDAIDLPDAGGDAD